LVGQKLAAEVPSATITAAVIAFVATIVAGSALH
jgi:hypothetical protein